MTVCAAREKVRRGIGGLTIWGTDEDVVTEEERKHLRNLLKQVGEEAFIKTVIEKGGMKVRKCLTAFHIRPVSPRFVENGATRRCL